MTWWIWVLLGLVLLIGELVTPGGFFAIFFGVAALVVGVLVRLGWAGDRSRSMAALQHLFRRGRGPFRRPLMRALKLDQAKKAVDAIAGEEAMVVEDVPPGGVGKAELRGSTWTARTEGTALLAKGQRCRVDRIEGLTLWLRA